MQSLTRASILKMPLSNLENVLGNLKMFSNNVFWAASTTAYMINKGFNCKNALGQSQKCPGQSQDPETGLGHFRIRKTPSAHLEIAQNPETAQPSPDGWAFQDPENAHGQSRDRPKSRKRAQHICANLLKKCKFQECSAIIFFLFVALITAAVNITTLSVRTCCCFTYLFGHNIYLPVTVYSLHILNTHLHFL